MQLLAAKKILTIGRKIDEAVTKWETGKSVPLFTDDDLTTDCDSVNEMKEKNREYFGGTREEAISLGYKPCGRCEP